MLEMVPGQWTLLIIHEMIHPVFKKPRGKPDKMRCALVSPISNDGPLVQPGEARYQVLDMETFLANVRHSSTSEARQEVEESVNFWKEKGKGSLDFGEAKEVHELMRVLEKEVTITRGSHGFWMCYGLNH